MYNHGVYVTIGGREFEMAFTLAALLQIKKRYGGIQEMSEVFNGPTINDWDSDEIKTDKMNQRTKAQSDALDELPWLITMLINQGEWLKDIKAEAVTAEWIALHIVPKDMGALMSAVMEAIAIGMGTEHKAESDKRDPVLEELDRKNAEGVGEN